MSVKLLTENHFEFLSLKGGCTGSFESTLVKMSICWRSHATAHIWAPTWENLSSEVCKQQRLRQACASARCIGSSESTLVKMSICWRSYATDHIWAPTRENLSSKVCEQQRHRPACASAQSDQRLCYSLFGNYHSRLATSEISVL